MKAKVRGGSPSDNEVGKVAEKLFQKHEICTYKFKKYKKIFWTENKMGVGLMSLFTFICEDPCPTTLCAKAHNLSVLVPLALSITFKMVYQHFMSNLQYFMESFVNGSVHGILNLFL